MTQYPVKVSVVIPVYNREAELRRAIRSALAQTIDDIEVLVVDDCSEIDLNKLVIEPLNDNRIRFFRIENKGYANVCRNRGVREARGEYVAMLDSDDEWLAEHLEKRIEFIEASAVDGLFGSHILDNSLEKTRVISRKMKSNESMADYLLTNGTAVTPTHFYKSSCAKQVEWDESLKRHQDYDFSIRFAEKFRFVPFQELTCIVHWAKGERRAESFESQMLFIEKHKSKISPRVYNQYHNKAFFQAVGASGVSPQIIAHYRRESARFPDQLTLVEYLAVMGYKKSALVRLFYRLKFAVRILLRFK